MKITIVDLLPGEEEETIIKCNSVTPKLLELINELKSQNEEEIVRAVRLCQLSEFRTWFFVWMV